MARPATRALGTAERHPAGSPIPSALLDTASGKLLLSLGGVAVLVAAGVAGFHAFFGSPWGLSVYQTVVTITTLGDARVAPATPAQYVFVGALSLFGYAAWGLFVAVVAGAVVSLDMRAYLGGASLEERISHLRGHTVVIGGGRVGQQVALELRLRGEEVLVVERDPDVASRLEQQNALVLVRDALDEGVLAEAGVAAAAGVVLALPDDAQNLYVLLALRDIAPDVRVAARAEGVRAERHLRALGVERVVLPTVQGGKRLARLIARPVATHFVDAVADESGLRLREEVVRREDALAGRQVRDIRLHLGETSTLLAIYRDGALLPLPSADTTIRTGDVLVLASTSART